MNAHSEKEIQACERQALRCGAVSLCAAAQQQGATASAVSRRLHVSSRTLRRWRRSPEAIPCREYPDRAVGRPRFALDRETRSAIRRAVKELGVRTGVATFQKRFPQVPRRVLAAVKNHYRRTLLRWRRRQLARLEWTQPGRVWAIDHAEPPLTIDNKYDYLLSVRDLGSGLQLAWEEIGSADADTTVTVLTRLFAEHGPPLVLKSDNGKALTQGGVPALLAQHHVTPLVSPVYRPQYNGSCEAGVKAMKTRTEDAATLADRSRHWTREDLAHALQIANEHHRAGPHAPSKLERWQERTIIGEEERDTFLLTLAINRGQHLLAKPGPLTKPQTKTLERQSVAQTLVELGQLIIHRRPNTTPNKEQKADRIR